MFPSTAGDPTISPPTPGSATGRYILQATCPFDASSAKRLFGLGVPFENDVPKYTQPANTTGVLLRSAMFCALPLEGCWVSKTQAGRRVPAFVEEIAVSSG